VKQLAEEESMERDSQQEEKALPADEAIRGVLKDWSAPLIQVDAFEVQLGAGLLVQLRGGAPGTVAILCDAGVHASGYASDHVLRKLPECFDRFEADYRVDLILGTHYDKDHLDGLVEVAKASEIKIGEAWLPPVANDASPSGVDEYPKPEDLLAFQFADEDGDTTFHDYLRSQKRICDRTRSLYRTLEGAAAVRSAVQEGKKRALDLAEQLPGHHRKLNPDLPFFLNVLSETDAVADEAGPATHADLEVDERFADVPRSLYDSVERSAERKRVDPWSRLTRQSYTPDASSLIALHRCGLAIARSAAKRAINATSLKALVDALRARGVPIRCRHISAGRPEYFLWNPDQSRFAATDVRTYQRSRRAKITQLGPSRELIRKHWHLIPRGSYLAFMDAKPVELRYITPSNQLSYVAKVEMENQGLLVCGDTGFVDFSRKRGSYYRSLLSAVKDLDFVQVAHHAGNNAHFYRVLLEAPYADQEKRSYLLLSHATQDKHRPSEPFRHFVELLRSRGADIRLLFTSEPSRDKVEDFIDLFARSTETPRDRGDVRLTWTRWGWEVEKHSIGIQ
jgi:hypothetical protein